MSFRRTSFRTQIAVATTILIVVLAFVLQAIVARHAGARVEREIGTRLAGIARQTAEALDQRMWARAGEVGLLTTLDVFQPPFQASRIRAVLDRLQEEIPLFTWVGFLDHTGTVVAGTGGILEGKDISARPVYVEGIRGSFVGDVHTAKLLAALLPAPAEGEIEFVDIAVAVRNAAGDPVGVLAAHLSWEWARETERSLLGPAGGEGTGIELFVIGRDGAVLLGPGRATGDRAPGLDAIARAATGRGGWLTERWPDGADYLTGYALGQGYGAYRGLGWTVLARQSVDRAFAPVEEMRRQIVGWSVGLALAFALLAWFAAGRMVSPLRRIAGAADRVRVGEADQIPAVDGNAEVATLSEALRHLIDTLRNKDTALGAMSDLAHHDALTGLANRVALAAHLEHAVPKARRERGALGFVCLDLDGFKPINDTHGHAVGDAVLRVVAARLEECVRGGDIVARLGGDEFTIVTAIPSGAGTDARRVAERVLGALRRPIVLDDGEPGAADLAGRELRIGCSIGIALWPADGETVEAVVRAADAALYRAKENGRNRIETTFDEAWAAC